MEWGILWAAVDSIIGRWNGDRGTGSGGSCGLQWTVSLEGGMGVGDGNGGSCGLQWTGTWVGPGNKDVFGKFSFNLY